MVETSKLSQAETERIAAALRRSNDREFEDMLEPIKRIYIDIEFLQDFRLGALIKLITTDVEYQYIREKLPIYSMSHGEPITSFFPELGFTEEQVKEYMQDKRHWEELAMDSPFYENVESICVFITQYLKHNQRVNYHEPIDVYIGCTDLLYCVAARRRLAIILMDFLDSVNLTFIPTSLYEFDEVDIDDYDVYMVASSNKLINYPSLIKKFEKMEMANKTIIGLEELDTTPEELKEAGTSLEDAFEATVEFCNMFVRFAFAKRIILV